MQLRLALLAAVASLAAAQAHAATPSVEIKDAVAQVTVIPEDRRDVRVEVFQPNSRLPLRIRTAGSRTIVDGGLSINRIRACRGAGDQAAVRVLGVGEVSAREMPKVVIHAPRDVDVAAGGAVYGSIGRAANVSLGNAGCGDWTVGNVERQLKINVAGSGDIRTGTSGQARLRVAGAGDVSTADVRGPLDVEVAGAGDVAVRSVAGPLTVHVAGSGDVSVAGGRAGAVNVSVMGSGNVEFRGVADSLTARIAGSGDVRAREVRGRVVKQVIGSGRVTIG